jgi:sporulation integral membrane protein YlbJ
MRSATIQTVTQRKPNKRIFTKVGIVCFLGLIFIFPASSYNGAKRGLLLWFNTILPTLLPFIILSNLIIRLQITKYLSKILYPLFHTIFRVSRGGCYPILIGLLSGIPVGAKSIADLVENDTIRTEEGQYLLGFCNNASPMFIMSFIAIAQLKQPNLRFILLLIIFGSGIITSIFYFKILPKSNKITKFSVSTTELIQNNSKKIEPTKFDFSLLDSAIMDGFEVLTKVGGYVILFSIPAQIISNMGNSVNIFKLVSIGILEITTGINHISNSNLEMNTKIALITMITAFGGLSGLAQTKSVISNTRLSIGTYFKVKLIHMTLAFLLATLFIKFLY